jgi:hypothetical protein
MDPAPDPLLLINLERPGIKLGTSGSVARNSDYTTEAVIVEKRHLRKHTPE